MIRIEAKRGKLVKTRGRGNDVNYIFNYRRDAIVAHRGKISSIKVSIFETFTDPPWCGDTCERGKGLAIRPPSLGFGVTKSSLGDGFLFF